MATRGVLYMVWGDRIRPVLQRSIDALKRVHPELPVEVCEAPDRGPFEGLLEKAKMLRHTPFDETLFLDADTVVMDRLDFGFEKARQFGLACCICECPWACRYGAIEGETVEYNTGVLFFTRGAARVFEAWEALAPEVDSSIEFLADGKPAVMPYNDQASFALAVEKAGIAPFVLPHNWNFRPVWQRTFFGRLKVWHDYSEVPESLWDLNGYYAKPGSVVQFHEMRE